MILACAYELKQQQKIVKIPPPGVSIALNIRSTHFTNSTGVKAHIYFDYDDMLSILGEHFQNLLLN